MEARNADIPNEALNPPLEKRLTAISDITLGVMISAFFPYCDPPQRKYPIEKGEKPVWWPETEPYKEPNNLKKKSKVKVLASIIENLIPNFSKIEKAVRKSKSLEKAMSSLESHIWSSILAYLKKNYKSDVVPVPVPNSVGPSVSPTEKEMRDKGKGVLQEAPQGEKEKVVEGLPNEGGSNASLLNVNQLSGNPSLENDRTEDPISNDILVQNDLLVYDQDFWRFMNNYQK